MFYLPVVYFLSPKFLIKGTILSLGLMLKCFTFNYLVLFFLAKRPTCLPKRTHVCLPNTYLTFLQSQIQIKPHWTSLLAMSKHKHTIKSGNQCETESVLSIWSHTTPLLHSEQTLPRTLKWSCALGSWTRAPPKTADVPFCTPLSSAMLSYRWKHREPACVCSAHTLHRHNKRWQRK